MLAVAAAIFALAVALVVTLATPEAARTLAVGSAAAVVVVLAVATESAALRTWKGTAGNINYSVELGIKWISLALTGNNKPRIKTKMKVAKDAISTARRRTELK